jgi:hypothetical protein
LVARVKKSKKIEERNRGRELKKKNQKRSGRRVLMKTVICLNIH